MKTKQHLQRMRDLLSDRSRWTKKAEARREDGIGVRHDDEEAVCWCLAGAYLKTVEDDGLVCSNPVLGKIRQQIGLAVNIPSFNDNDLTSHQDILCVLDKAIADCDKETL